MLITFVLVAFLRDGTDSQYLPTCIEPKVGSRGSLVEVKVVE